MFNTLNEVNDISEFNSSLEASNSERGVLLKPAKVNKKLLQGLSNFQKTLLITDGTVTELLEYYLEEQIKVEKIYEELESNIKKIPKTHKIMIEEKDLPVLTRVVLLQGTSTLKNWVYAESSIFIDHLTEDFRDDLIVSKLPIGKLWEKYRFESYKTDFSIRKEKADEKISNFLEVNLGSDILSRTYCVYSNNKKTMIITEKFSIKHFLDK